MALMTTMRNRMHLVLWALLILFVLSMSIGGLVGGANIVDQIFGRVNPRDAIGVINGEKISPDAFSRLVSDQLEQTRNSGQEITDRELDNIRRQVWDSLIQDILIQQAVKKLGLAATDEEVLFHLRNTPPTFLRNNPVFQTDGQFDPAKYEQAISNPQGNEWAPIEQFMKSTYIPNYKLQQFILSSVSVSDAEVRDEYVKRYIDYTIDALHITNRMLNVDSLKLGEEELLALYKERIDEFQQPELRVLRFVKWEKRASKEDSIAVYNDALELKQRAESGSDFAELANIYSEDPGNQITPDSGRGGDLGWFGRGQMVPPFEQAAFSANPGKIVGPVLSNFGYHIIKVLDNNDKGQVRAAHILLKLGIGPNTKDEIRRQSTLFSYDAQDYGFDAALDTHNVTSQSTKPLNSEALFIPGIGQFRYAVRFAFGNEVGTISEPIENENYYVVFTVDSIIPPGPSPFEDVRGALEREVTQERTMEAARLKAEEFRNMVDSGISFEEILQQYENLEKVENEKKKLSRGFSSLGRSFYVIGSLLEAQPGDLTGPVKTARGYAIINVLDIQAFDSTDFEIKKEILYRDLLSSKQNQVFNDWLQVWKDEAEIIDNRKYYF